MSRSFNSTAAGSTADYIKYLYGPITKTDRVNQPTLLEFSFASVEDPAFVKLVRGNYVTFSTLTYGKWFTGYIQNTPSPTYLGVNKNRQPVWQYKYTAASDDIIIGLQPLGIIPPYINTTQGAILSDIITRLAPGRFDLTNIATGNAVVSYQVDPQKKFVDIVKEFADSSYFRFWARDLKIYFQQQDTTPATITVDQNSNTFTPSSLTVTTSTDNIVNDAIVLGDVEPQDYVTEYFVSDGFQGAFPLLSEVYGAVQSTLLDETFSSGSIDLTKWVVVDPSSLYFSLSNGYLNVVGGTNTAAWDRYIRTLNPINLAGNIRLTNGEYDFVSASSGMIASLWTVPVPAPSLIGCIYGLKLSKTGSSTVITPVCNGFADATQAITISDYSSRYVIRTLATFQQIDRAVYTYSYISQAGVVGTYGGTGLADLGTYTTNIAVINPTTGLVTAEYSMTLTGAVTNTQFAAYYSPVITDDLHCAVTSITLSIPVQASLSEYDLTAGDWTLKGTSGDIGGTADTLEYAWQQVFSQDRGCSACVRNMVGDTTALAGVMVRNDLGTGSIHIAALMHKNGDAFFYYRDSLNGATVITGPIVNLPFGSYLQVSAGDPNNNFVPTAWYSLDNVTWTVLGTAPTVIFNTVYYVGLAASAHATDQSMFVDFSNLTFPAQTNLALAASSINTTYSGGTLTVTTTIIAETVHNTSANAAYNQTNFPANFGTSTWVDTSGTTIVVDPAKTDLSLNPVTPGHVSPTSVKLLVPNYTGKWYAHIVPWFRTGGGGGHIDIGVACNTTAWVNAMLTDVSARGFDGIIIDWYGSGSFEDGVTLLIKAAIGAYPNLTYSIMIDQGCYTTTAQLQAHLIYIRNQYLPPYNSHYWTRVLVNGSQGGIISFFGTVGGVDYALAKSNASLTLNSFFIMQGPGSLSSAYADGCFDWVQPYSTGVVGGDPYNLAAMQAYVSGCAGTSKLTLPCIAPGFNGMLTASVGWSKGKYLPRDSGKCWLQQAAQLNAHLTPNIIGIQVPTWNDWQEGSQVEDGIENNIVVTASISVNTLSWSVSGGTGDESTIANYKIMTSPDGVNAAVLATVATGGSNTFNLASIAGWGAITYTVFVVAVGKGCIRDHISNQPTYSPGGSGGTITGPSDGYVTNSATWIPEIIGPNEIDAQDGMAPVATIVNTAPSPPPAAAFGSTFYTPSSSTLQFLKDTSQRTTTVPTPATLMRLTYRAAGPAVGRVQSAASIAAEATGWGDNGKRSVIRRDLTPLPPTWKDCEAAAAALIADQSYQHYDGTYTHQSLWDFSGEPMSGTILKFLHMDATAFPQLQAEAITQVKTVFLSAKPQEIFEHTITFGRPNLVQQFLATVADPKFSNTVPSNTSVIPISVDITSLPSSYGVDVLQVSLLTWDSVNWNWDIGVAPPSGGGFEIRYTNQAWGTLPGKNLVTRLTGSSHTFSTPRSQAGRVVYVKAYDASGNYSRFPAVGKANLPLVPVAPTASIDFTNPVAPIINVALPVLLADVWGVEIRGPDNITVLYKVNLVDLTSFTTVGASAVNTVPFTDTTNDSLHMSYYVYTYNLLGEYSLVYNVTAINPDVNPGNTIGQNMLVNPGFELATYGLLPNVVRLSQQFLEQGWHVN